MRHHVPPTVSIFIVLYCTVFIHFYNASHSMNHSEALPTTATNTVSEFTRRSATGNCKRRTCPRSLRDDLSWIRTHPPPVERHQLYKCVTTPHIIGKLNILDESG